MNETNIINLNNTNSNEVNQNDLNIFFNQEQFSIIKNYKKIHRIIFKHGVYIIVLLMALIWGIILQNQKDSKSITLSYKNNHKQLNKLLQEQKKQINIQNFQVLIPYENIENHNGQIISFNNLIKYKGIIFPQNANINTSRPEFDILSQSPENISKEELINFLTILLSGNKQRESKRKPIFPINQGIIKEFNLACLQDITITKQICNMYLTNFYTYGAFYNLQQSESDLTIIMNLLRQKHISTEPLCSTIIQYSTYIGKTSEKLENLMNQCSLQQRNDFYVISNFIKINNELLNGIISNTTYTNKELNTYKLLSLTQIITRNIESWIINKGSISNYLEYIQELTNKDNGENNYLDPLYKNIIYLFNNDILLKVLEEHDNSLISKTDITVLTNKITLINKGNNILKIKGLEKQLTNPNLIQYRNIENIETKVIDIEDLLKPFLELNNKLRIITYNISENREEINLQTEINSETVSSISETSLRAKIDLYKKNSVLYATSINIIEEEDLSIVINQLLANKEVSLNQLFSLIDEQYPLFYNNKNKEIYDLCEETKSLAISMNILICNDNILDVMKDGINYTFNLFEGSIQNISISDKNLENIIQNFLQNTIIIRDNTLQSIQTILSYEQQIEEKNIEQKLIITENMRFFLNTTPNIQDIKDNDKNYLINFSLREFKLKGVYDIETHTISEIYYVIDTERTLLIRDLSIPLNKDNENDLAHIANNPRIFLRLFNTAAFDKYERMLKEE